MIEDAHNYEKRRLKNLQDLNILDSCLEERFDRLARLVRHMFSAPVSFVNLVDENRVWYKAAMGVTIPIREVPRTISFCSHTIEGDGIFTVEDALADTRFSSNPVVVNAPHFRFYAGHPLSFIDGTKLGTLCVYDTVPRQLNADEKNIFRDLARLSEMELNASFTSVVDDLTQVSNRRGFMSLAEKKLQECRHRKD